MFLSEFDRGKKLREDLVIEFYYQDRSKFLGRKHLHQKHNSIMIELHIRLDEMANEISECQLNDKTK